MMSNQTRHNRLYAWLGRSTAVVSLYRWFVIASLTTTLGACIQEIEIDTTLAGSYIFIDGSVTQGERTHKLRIGRSPGPGLESFRSPPTRSVQLEEVRTQQRWTYVYNPRNDVYTLEDVLIGEGAYRLHVDFLDGSSLVSKPDSLLATDIGIRGIGKLFKRLQLNGDSVAISATAQVTIELPDRAQNEVLVTTHKITYQLTDNVCDPFDPADACYFEEEPLVNQLSVIPLSRYAPNTTASLTIGSVGFTWRLAEKLVISIVLDRYSAEAEQYYRSVEGSLRTRDGFFSAKTQTLPGNLSLRLPDGSQTNAVIGYFGVRDRTTLHVPLNSEEIKQLAGPRACSGFALNPPPGAGCCFCTQLPYNLVERPDFW